MTASVVKGWALPVAEHTDSENLHPASFFSLDPKRVKAGFLAGFPAEFRQDLKPGMVILGGSYFGAGSSREVILQSFVLNGVVAVCAPSFARIFFRNAINFGLPVIELPEATTFATRGQSLEIDLARATIANHDDQTSKPLSGINDVFLDLLSQGRLQREEWQQSIVSDA